MDILDIDLARYIAALRGGLRLLPAERGRARVPECPYAGLMPFTEEQADFFFGREAEREIITANLMASRLTLFYGPSGVGKSSVLNAGVAYHLRLEAAEAVARRGTAEFAHRDVPGLARRSAPRPRTRDRPRDRTPGAGATFADRLQSSDRGRSTAIC